MKTKTIELYEFDELPEDVREEVLDRMRYINVDDSYWHDYYDGKTGFNSAEIKKYRLDLQESGDLLKYKNLYFDLDRSWYIQFIDPEFAHDETARKFLGVPKNLWAKTHWMFVNQDHGGNSHSSTRLEYEYDYYFGESYREFTSKQIEILDRAVERFSDKMEEALKDLQKQYEYLTSDEAIIETIEANEYTFTESGRMENS